MATILVTGASGYVAKHVIAQLITRGHSVRGTLRDMGKAPQVAETISQMTGDDSASLAFASADLLEDAGWDEAMQGVDTVMHVATMVLGEEPKDPDTVIKPAVEGTRRVFEAAHRAGVKRIVMTGSIAAVGYGRRDRRKHQVYTEKDWTEVGGPEAWSYADGKTLAEKWAWDFCREHSIGLTTILGGAIFGPPGDSDASVSVSGITQLLDGSAPGVPDMGFNVVDVRDVAEMHIAAMEKDEAIGERYLASGTYMPFRDVAAMMRDAFPWAKVPSRVFPSWLLRLMVPFTPTLKMIRSDIGIRKEFDGSKGAALLGRPYRSAKETLVDTAERLIELGIVKPPGS